MFFVFLNGVLFMLNLFIIDFLVEGVIVCLVLLSGLEVLMFGEGVCLC